MPQSAPTGGGCGPSAPRHTHVCMPDPAIAERIDHAARPRRGSAFRFLYRPASGALPGQAAGR